MYWRGERGPNEFPITDEHLNLQLRVLLSVNGLFAKDKNFGISMSSLMTRPTIPRMQTFGFEVNNSVVAATAATPLLFRPRLAQLLHRRPVHRLRPRRHRRSKQWLWSVIMTSKFTNTAVARRITVIRGDDPLMIAGGAGESRSP
jgi:hypothetical protein